MFAQTDSNDDEALDAGLDKGLAEQARLLAGLDAKRFARQADEEVKAALQFATERMESGIAPICIGTGMILGAGLILRVLFKGADRAAFSKVFQNMLNEAIVEGP